MDISNQGAPYDIENPSIQIEHSIIKELGSLSYITSNCTIYKVPERLRQVNEKAYTPRVVSIGPFHHGKERLIAMEEQKRRYLRGFLSRTNVSLAHYIHTVRDQEERLRSCYADPIVFSSDDFVRIILVDAIFVIEVLLRFSCDGFDFENDRIFNKPWMLVDVWPDMLLLENQLPFFILEHLFDPDHFDPDMFGGPPSIINLSRKFFHEALHTVGADENLMLENSEVDIAHFVDFVRFLCLPQKAEDSKPGGKRQTTLPCISELHRAGVNFKVGSSTNLFDIKFANGTLEIPKLEINDVTEVIIRNLIALEECHYPWNNMMSVYALTMDRFVNTSLDVELLVKHGIIENMLGDDWDVASMINNLGAGVSAKGYNVYYVTLYEDLNRHCKASWNTWKANLRQIYFNTPWTTMKVIAAVVLLILTLIQTVCSVISLIKPSK